MNQTKGPKLLKCFVVTLGPAPHQTAVFHTSLPLCLCVFSLQDISQGDLRRTWPLLWCWGHSGHPGWQGGWQTSSATLLITVKSCLLAAHNDVISCQVFKHPRYNGFTINNDITLIKLASPVRMGVRVSPVCVAEGGDNFPGDMTCVTTGWGLTRHNGESRGTEETWITTRGSI